MVPTEGETEMDNCSHQQGLACHPSCSLMRSLIPFKSPISQ